VAKPLSRFPSIDFIRGFAIFANVIVHIFTDVYNIGTLTTNVFNNPISVLVILVLIGYFGSFGSLFILISGTGNMISMQKAMEEGKPVKQVILKQLIGGIILLVFSFLVEGFFQFYGFLGTIGGLNGHVFDVTRIVWHAFSETPVMCLAFGMIFTALIQAVLSYGGGFKKHVRNMLVYAVLAIVVAALTQPIWNFCKAVGPAGFPNAWVGAPYASDYKVDMPMPGAGFLGYISAFFLMMLGGSDTPVFPFLAMSFAGNIIGILLVSEAAKEHPDPHVPRYGMLSALFVMVAGFVMIPVLHVGFSSVLPVSSVGDITGINNGLDGAWIPWWCFLLAGEIFIVFMLIRLIEYRGIGDSFGRKSGFIRRFGIPAFSVYAWHRFISIPAVYVVCLLAGAPFFATGRSITGTSLSAGWTILALTLSVLSVGAVLIAWEKVGYIGGIEWMMGEVSAMFGPLMVKAKSTQGTNLKWWEHGKIDVDRLFYHPQWLNIINRDEAYHEKKSESIFSVKLAILGLFVGVFAPMAMQIAYTSRKTEGDNAINKRGFIIAVIGTCLFVFWIILTSFLTLPMLGIHL
jgi:UPF0716 family protein affecting phage T7 exclusion